MYQLYSNGPNKHEISPLCGTRNVVKKKKDDAEEQVQEEEKREERKRP
jgi:hypothetical protein